MPHSKLRPIVLSFILLFLFFSNCAFASLDQKYEKFVRDFINCVKEGNKQKLVKFIQFPLSRQYPIPSIDTPEDFLLRFNEVFDDKLIEVVSKSDPLEDWSDMGWRGIMLRNGILWMDFDGNVTCINYQSKNEKQKRIEIINAEKKTLYSGLQNYLEPVLKWKTKNHLIRIDHLGGYNYRYAVWPINKRQSEEPDLILDHGELEFEGSGGNHYYEFKNGIYKYRCNVWIIGAEDTPPGELQVYKNDNLILNEPVIEFKGEFTGIR